MMVALQMELTGMSYKELEETPWHVVQSKGRIRRFMNANKTFLHESRSR